MTERLITNATLVTPEGEIRGAVRIADGRIAEVLYDSAPQEAGAADWQGDYLLPGVIDIHTDHFEKHVFPRSHVQWDEMTAVMAHDAQMIGGGTTTVFDAICVGASMKQPERREILGPCLDAFSRLKEAGALRADHLIHLRCEVSDTETPALVAANIDKPLVKVASVMNHAPGDRQSPDVERYIARQAINMQISLEEARARTDELIARAAAHADNVRAEVASMVLSRGMALMSHDDATDEHVEIAHREGSTIAEFPTTIEAARAARARGMATVAGAPNILRGGSQSGNVAVRDLLVEHLVDMLSSDYVPRSPLDAAFAIADDPALDHGLYEAFSLVTRNPARAAGLDDRGAVEVGLRADIIRVRRIAGRIQMREAWVEGVRAS